MEFVDTGSGTKALLDSGAGISLLPKHVYDTMTSQPELLKSDRRIGGANAAPVDCYGMTFIDIKIGSDSCKHRFYVVEDEVFPILGRDYTTGRVVLDHVQNIITVKGERVRAFDLSAKVSNRVALIHSVTIKPGQEIQLAGKLEGRGNPNNIPCLVEPAKTLFPRTGAMVARTLTIPSQNTCAVRMLNASTEPIRLWKGMTMGVLHQVEEQRPYRQCTDDELPLNRQQTTTVNSIETVQKQIEHDLRTVNQKKKPPKSELPEHLQDLYTRSIAELNESQQQSLRDLLCVYQDAFAKDSNDIGLTKWVKHDVDTAQEEPVRQRPRRLRFEQRPVLQQTIADLRKQGRIRPSTSEWASNVVLVRKKQDDPTKQPEWRMCIDYRELNTKTKNPDSYMLPRIDDTLDSLSRAKFFCTLDIQQGYHNVELTERAKQKTAFHVPCVNPPHWEWIHMPFGLVGAPRTFQRLMDRMLQGLEHKIALAYLDDVIVYGAEIDEVINNLDTVFERILAAGVKLKAKKCHLFQRETTYLGHVISHEGVKCEPKKVEAVNAWHPPRNLKHLRSFLGMVCYYSKFIPQYAEVSLPLYELLKGKVKSKLIIWQKRQQDAFDKLKTALISAPVLAYPTPHGRYILDTDASQFAYGAVLSQIQTDEQGNEVERVIAYHSKMLNSAEQRYCARRRELLAIVKSVKYFEVYVRGPKFTIRTDHASLQYIKTLTTMPDQMYRWILALEQYDYKIVVRPGKDHTNADTLSRVPCSGKICICDRVEEFEQRSKTSVQHVLTEDSPEVSYELVNAVSFNPRWTAVELRKHQEADLDLGPVYRAFAKNSKQRPRWEDYSIESPACKAYFAEWRRLQLHNGVLYRRWENDSGTVTRLQVLVPRALRQAICEEVHDGRTTAHMGKRRAMRLLMKSVHWFKMDYDVNQWIRTCAVCQKRKIPKKPAQAPSRAFLTGHVNERVSLDVVGPLKQSQSGNTVILCMTDHFSKYSRAFALPDQKALTVAKCFVDNWMHVFGQPMMLHADKGTNFESKLMQQICTLYGIDKTRTTSYRPQANAQTERYNQTLITVLSMLVDKDTSDNWDEKLPIAVTAYNCTDHASTKFSPHRLFFGREIAHNLDRMLPNGEREEYESWDDYVRTLDEASQFAYEIARQAIGKSVNYQKRYYDRKQNLHEYKTGDAVLLRDRVQQPRGEGKLANKFVGPYFVIDVLSDIHFRIARDSEEKPQIVHHDAMKKFHLREPVDLQWVYDRSKYHRRTADPATAEDITTNLTDMMRRLRSVEVQMGDFTRTAGRKSRSRKAVLPRPQQQVEPQEAAQPPREQPALENAAPAAPNRPRTTDEPVDAPPPTRAATDKKKLKKPKTNSTRTGKHKAVKPPSNSNVSTARPKRGSTKGVPKSNSTAKPAKKKQTRPEEASRKPKKITATSKLPTKTSVSTDVAGKNLRRSTRTPKPKKW